MPPAITHYRIALIRRRVYLGLKEMINIVFFVYSIKLLFFFSFKEKYFGIWTWGHYVPIYTRQ